MDFIAQFTTKIWTIQFPYFSIEIVYVRKAPLDIFDPSTPMPNSKRPSTNPEESWTPKHRALLWKAAPSDEFESFCFKELWLQRPSLREQIKGSFSENIWIAHLYMTAILIKNTWSWIHPLESLLTKEQRYKNMLKMLIETRVVNPKFITVPIKTFVVMSSLSFWPVLTTRQLSEEG